MLVKTGAVALLIILIFNPGYSQNYSVIADSTQKEEPKKAPKPKDTNRKKTFVGGGLGLGFGSHSGFFNGSIMLGYNVTKQLQAAGKVSYWYNWGIAPAPNGKGTDRYEGSIYAFSVPMRFVLFKGVFLHAEPEYMNLPQYRWVRDANSSSGYSLSDQRVDAVNFYVGGGAYLHFTGNSGPFFQVLWNLNETENSFYSNPYWQVGYAIGF